MFRLNTFGALHVCPSDNPQIRPVSQPRRLAILALLAVAGARGMTREKVLAYLWPDMDEERGRRVLTQALYGLRHELSADAVVGTKDLRLNSDVITTDIAEFGSAIDAGRHEAAATLYVGPFLDGFYVPGADDFDRWVDEQRNALSHRYGELLDRLANDTSSRGEHAAALGWWKRLAALNPLNARAAVGVMRAYAAVGDRHAALNHARLYEALAAEENLPVEREMRALALQLRESTSTEIADAHPTGPAPALGGPSPIPIPVPPEPSLAQVPRSVDATLRAELPNHLQLREKLRDGAVYTFLADDTHLRRKVLVKAVNEQFLPGLSATRFERGMRLAAQLHHPHIVPVLAAGRAGPLPYYIAPFLDGESLSHRIAREGPIRVDDAVRVLRHVASALAYAHRRGVIHRDIIPDNVHLTGEFALLSNFGVAKALLDSSSAESPFMSAGAVVGTPGYMAPEQAAADPATDHRADLYAFGVLAYEALTAKRPFDGRTMGSVLSAQLSGTPPPITELRPDIPERLAALVMRCLARRPADRPQSADEIVQALDAVATTLTASA